MTENLNTEIDSEIVTDESDDLQQKVDDVKSEAEDKEPDGDDQKEQEASSDDEEESSDDLPKNVKKALDKNRRYIRNLREREKALREEIEKLKAEKVEPKELKEEEFEGSYGDFIKQQAIEEAKALLSQNQQQQKIDQLTQQQQQLYAEQDQVIAQEVSEYAKQSDDFANVVRDHAAEFDTLPQEVAAMFYDLENPSLAAYAIAKEGKIDNLKYMSPYMAASEIMAAQERGRRYLDQTSKKQVSKAPAPINAIKGKSSGSKSLADMSPDELVKKYIK